MLPLWAATVHKQSTGKQRTDQRVNEDKHIQKLLSTTPNVIVADEAHELRTIRSVTCILFSMHFSQGRSSQTYHIFRLGLWYTQMVGRTSLALDITLSDLHTCLGLQLQQTQSNPDDQDKAATCTHRISIAGMTVVEIGSNIDCRPVRGL